MGTGGQGGLCILPTVIGKPVIVLDVAKLRREDLTSATLPGELIYVAHKLSADFKEVLLVPISDIHFGTGLCSEHHLDRTIAEIRDTPNMFTLLNGDLAESAIRDSLGDIYKQSYSPQEQRDWIIKKFKPIKHKILGMTIGNHENRIYTRVGIDICKDIAEELSVPYRPEGMLLKISFGVYRLSSARNYTYWIYMTHGYGGARTAPAKAIKVERTSTFIHADIYIMSHDHTSNAAPVVYLMPDPRTSIDSATGRIGGKLIAHRKMLVKSNAYVKWGGYAEMGGFSPNDLETPIIKLAGTGQKRVRVEI